MEINSYSSAMSSLQPGSFVPDIGAGAPKSQPLADDGTSDTGITGAAGASGVSFKDTISKMLNDVNDKQVASAQASVDLATGRSNDLEGTVKAAEEASLAMQMTLSVRNQILTAYTAIEQMQF